MRTCWFTLCQRSWTVFGMWPRGLKCRSAGIEEKMSPKCLVKGSMDGSSE